MDEPSAMAFASVHGRNEKPRVNMSESDRTPGYRNRSQVPPIASRDSKIANDLPGHSRRRWQAAPTPESPAPMIRTSTCSADIAYLVSRAPGADHIRAYTPIGSNDRIPRLG